MKKRLNFLRSPSICLFLSRLNPPPRFATTSSSFFFFLVLRVIFFIFAKIEMPKACMQERTKTTLT